LWWSGPHALKPVSKGRPNLLRCRLLLSKFVLQQCCSPISEAMQFRVEWGVAVGGFKDCDGNVDADLVDDVVRENHVSKCHPVMLRTPTIVARVASAIADD